ncbi:MAG: hypothetical protein ACRD0P_04010 [Stackebrandtia sp.]
MNEPETGSTRRSRGRYWLAGVLVVVLAAAAGTWYMVWGSEDDPCAPREPTGVTEPVKKAKDGAGDKWFTVAESGFMPYRQSEYSTADEGVSFGYLVENPSEYVLYDARLRVRFETPDGRNPTEHVSESDRKEKSAFVKDVRLPVLFPGQRAGLGGQVYTWGGSYTDKDGDYIEPEKVDYESLKMTVELVSGEWWKVHNDKYEFGKATGSNTKTTKTQPSEWYFDFEENPGVEADVKFDVDLASCRDHTAYETTLLAYDKDGEIVGGTISDDTGGAYEPGTEHGSAQTIDTPGRDLTYKAYPYAKPVKPKLAK